MLESAWLLLVPPLLLRLLPFRPAHEQRFHPLGDLLLPLLVAALGLWLQVQITELRIGELWAASDFAEYCSTALGTLDPAKAHQVSPNRSRLSSLLPAWFAQRWGVLDAFALATWVSVFVCNLGIWTWGRALHSRLAGSVAVVFVACLPMAAQFSKTLSLYPETTAVLVLASGFGALALRHRHLALRLLAGATVGLALLVDVRGLAWALCVAPLGLLACLGLPWKDWRQPPWLRIGLGLLLFWLPIQASWFAARWAYPPDAISLELQSNAPKRFQDLGVTVDTSDLPDYPGFIYGRSDVRTLPDTLRYVLAEGELATPQQLEQSIAVGAPRAARIIDPWLPIGAGALLLAALALRKRPQLLLALAATSVPFLVALKRTIEFLMAQERMVGQAQLLLAVLMGVAYAGLALGELPRRDQAQRSWPPAWAPSWAPQSWPAWSRHAWRALAFLLPLALVLNWLPSHLSPWASWRNEATVPEGFLTLHHLADEAATGEPSYRGKRTPFVEVCVARIRADLEEGPPRFTEALFEEP